MPKPRKTFEVEKLKRMVNGALDAPLTSREERLALASLLSSVLMDTGNYRGFNYLPSEHRSEGEPGHVFANGEESPVLRAGYDDSRRSYH